MEDSCVVIIETSFIAFQRILPSSGNYLPTSPILWDYRFKQCIFDLIRVGVVESVFSMHCQLLMKNSMFFAGFVRMAIAEWACSNPHFQQHSVVDEFLYHLFYCFDHTEFAIKWWIFRCSLDLENHISFSFFYRWKNFSFKTFWAASQVVVYCTSFDATGFFLTFKWSLPYLKT